MDFFLKDGVTSTSISSPLAEVADPLRNAALASYDILDTPAETGFDDVVRLACQICATPVALVSLVSTERQWFKARVGFEPSETPIEQSVCAYALADTGTLVIPDMLLDPRTVQNTLVTGAPFVRFYAGAPLVTPSGLKLGTICVLDTVPRLGGLTKAQIDGLQALARQVMSLLEMRRALAGRDIAIARHRTSLVAQDTLIATQRRVSMAGGDLATVLDLVVKGVIEAVPHTEGCVFEEIEGEDLVYRSAVGTLAPHAGLRVPIKTSLSGHCVMHATAIRCADATKEPRSNPDALAILGLKSCIVVPVSRDGSVIGVLLLQSAAADVFSDRDLQLAQLFAGTISGGLAAAGEAEARRAVRASEARYRTVFESAIDYAIVVMDPAGRVIDWNEGAHRVMGWTHDEMVGRSVETFFTREDIEAGTAAKEMQAALAVGRGADERWHLRKDNSRFWANGEMMVLRDEAGAAVGFVKMLRDRTEQRNAVAALQASEASLRTILATIPVGIMIAEAPSGRIVGRNAALDVIAGGPGAEAKNLQTYGQWISFHADGRQVEAREYPLARLLNEDIDEAKLQVEYQRRDESRVWIDIVGRPLRDPEGRRIGAVIAVSDIDSRKKAEAIQSLMNHELSHRMKNLIAMVQAIAMQTMRGATDVAIVRTVLNDRLVVMSRAHDLLLDGFVGKTQIEPVVRSGIGVHDADHSGRFRFTGKTVEIGSRAALSLAMMIHELSTNAAKYGALAVPEGRVDVDWAVDADQRLAIVWRESDGPEVAPPSRKGFGSRLIERSLSGILGGTVSLTFASTGVVCNVAGPLASFQAED